MPVYNLIYLSDFKHAIDQNTINVVDFKAKWCNPCKQLAPKMEELAGKYPQFNFYQVDVDAAGDIANQEEISSIPTICFYKKGKRLDSVVGADYPLIKLKLERF